MVMEDEKVLPFLRFHSCTYFQSSERYKNSEISLTLEWVGRNILDKKRKCQKMVKKDEQGKIQFTNISNSVLQFSFKRVVVMS